MSQSSYQLGPDQAQLQAQLPTNRLAVSLTAGSAGISPCRGIFPK